MLVLKKTMNDESEWIFFAIFQFRSYLNSVLESTVDTCPLPLATIYKADTLICHDFAASINGLWLSLFVYMFLIIFGLCICGLCIYKRSQSLSSNRVFLDVPQYQNYAFWWYWRFWVLVLIFVLAIFLSILYQYQDH
jgi:hypothetical protein